MQPARRNGDFVAGENAEQLVDFRDIAPAAVPCRARPGSPPRSHFRRGRASSSRNISWIVSCDSRLASPMNPHVLITTKSAPSGSAHHAVAVQLQQSGHALAVDQVLGTSEADQGIGAAGDFPLGHGMVVSESWFAVSDGQWRQSVGCQTNPFVSYPNPRRRVSAIMPMTTHVRWLLDTRGPAGWHVVAQAQTPGILVPHHLHLPASTSFASTANISRRMTGFLQPAQYVVSASATSGQLPT